MDLFSVLALLAAEPELRSGEYVAWLREWFGCSVRAAKDALAVLLEAGYLEVDRDREDRRLRRYRPSGRGRELLMSEQGPRLAGFARRLFTGCPSPRQKRRQQQERASGELARRLERAEHYLLGPAMPAPALRSRMPAAAPRRPPRGQEAPVGLIVEPRCKVCQSAERAEIDLALAAGGSQASVRRAFNSQLGSDYFSASGISRHLRNHLSEADPRLRALLQLRLDRHQQAQLERYQQASTIVEAGLQALAAGLIEPSARELLNALQLREQLDQQPAGDDLAEMQFEFDAFKQAVEETLGPRRWRLLEQSVQRRRAHQAELDDYAKRRRLLEPDFSYLPRGAG